MVKKYPTKLAINSHTYREVYDLVIDREYRAYCTSTGVDILLDILVAARENRPLIIPPKFGKVGMPMINGEQSSEFGLFLYSSGSTTGERVAKYLPATMIMANAANSIKCHNMSELDRVLTVCTLSHTGGINAQTIAALTVGAQVVIEPFNAFNFHRLVNEHKITISHLVPVMIDALIKVDSQVEFTNLQTVMVGSDCVTRAQVEYLLDKDVDLIINYGMTEAGPIMINHRFQPGDDLSIFDAGVPLGTKVWGESIIIGQELHLKSGAISSGGWLSTGDCVYRHGDWYIYTGRLSSGGKIIPKKYD